MTVARLTQVDDPATGTYTAIVFWCPGCEVIVDGERQRGLHMLPVNSTTKTPQWDFDGNLAAPTLNPSILTRTSWQGEQFAGHSFMRAGQMEFLGDCTHQLAGQTVPLPDLPEWASGE